VSTAVSFADAERAYLADLLEHLGPESPTLCAGWRTEDLVAHLVIRERRPDAAPGIVVPLMAPWTHRVQEEYRRRGYPALVAMFRSGPPRLSPFSIPAVAGTANSVEFFVHHEDVRRAQPDWSPRAMDQDVEALLWGRIARQGRLMFRRAGVGVRVRRPSGSGASPRAGDAERLVRPGSPEVTITGEPSELVLFAFGRKEHARVELSGDEAARDRLRQAKLGI
jgi:uncharacterized protein (TIGR03085 family)